MSEHCIHRTGRTHSTMTTKAESITCCRCGGHGWVHFRLEHHTLEGHGPHFTEKVWVQEKLEWNAQECAA